MRLSYNPSTHTLTSLEATLASNDVLFDENTRKIFSHGFWMDRTRVVEPTIITGSTAHNLNSDVTPGTYWTIIYLSNIYTNLPVNTSGELFVGALSNQGDIYQRFTANDNRVFIRSRKNNVWTTWNNLDDEVKLLEVTTNSNRPLILGALDNELNADNQGTLFKIASKFFANPSTGNLTTVGLTANTLNITGSASLSTLNVTGNANFTSVITGNLNGNATTATLLQNARTISLASDISGSASFNGSANITINATIGTGKVTNAMLAGSIANNKLANSSITIAGTSVSLGGSITAATIGSALTSSAPAAYATSAGNSNTVGGYGAATLRRGSWNGRIINNVVNISNGLTTKEFIVKTKIPFLSGSYMPSIWLKGYAYGDSKPVDVHFVFYVYDSTFCGQSAVSYGAWKPSEISLFTYTIDNTKYIGFGFKCGNGVYYPKMWLDYGDVMMSTMNYYDGWTVEFNTSSTSFIPTQDLKTISYTSLNTNITGSAGSVAWSGITSKPTTLSGYGITDASVSTHTHSVKINGNTKTIAATGGTAVDLGSYLPLAGGTLTGSVLMPADKYQTSSTYGLHMNNSDIIGINSLYTGDLANNTSEGIRFYRDSSHYDSLTASSGELYFKPNDVLAGSALSTANKVIHSGNYDAYLPFLNSTTNHATNSSVIYAPTAAGTQNYTLIANASGIPTWTALSSLIVGRATDTGDGTMNVHPQSNNEVNFGGTSNSSTIYFGYRANGSKSIPTLFVFGSSTGTASIKASEYYEGGTSLINKYVSLATSQTISGNKTFTGTTSINNLTVSGNITNGGVTGSFSNSAITASSHSATLIPTQEAVWNAITSGIAANDAMIFKGTIGTNGTVTALPAIHDRGWAYKVITAGTYAGYVCEVGDLIICIADRTSGTDTNDEWTVVQSNLDGAVIGPSSSTANAIAIYNNTTGKLIKNSSITIDTNKDMTGGRNTSWSGNVTSPKFTLGTTNEIALNSSRVCFGTINLSAASGINAGSLLISNAWADYTKVPTNGIYSKGDIKGNSALSIAGATTLSSTLSVTGAATLSTLSVSGNAVFTSSIVGNLSGNASTATILLNARTITVGNKALTFNGSANLTFNLSDIGASVSNTWTAGTTAGPTISTTVNGVTGTAVAIPTASSSASGIVTTGAQIFAGLKTFSDGISTSTIKNSTVIGFYNGTAALTINTGGVLASNLYADASKVPTNGIYAKGNISTGGSYTFLQTSYTGTLSATSLTAARTWTLPNNSGTIALTSQIPTVTNFKWANLTMLSAVAYNTEPEFKTIKIGNGTASATATTYCKLEYDATNKCLKFIFV